MKTFSSNHIQLTTCWLCIFMLPGTNERNMPFLSLASLFFLLQQSLKKKGFHWFSTRQLRGKTTVLSEVFQNGTALNWRNGSPCSTTYLPNGNWSPLNYNFKLIWDSCVLQKCNLEMLLACLVWTALFNEKNVLEA